MALCSIAYTQTNTEKYLGDDGILYILQLPDMKPIFCKRLIVSKNKCDSVRGGGKVKQS